PLPLPSPLHWPALFHPPPLPLFHDPLCPPLFHAPLYPLLFPAPLYPPLFPAPLSPPVFHAPPLEAASPNGEFQFIPLWNGLPLPLPLAGPGCISGSFLKSFCPYIMLKQ
ncbi:hypothetical protein PMAYCL1PPCAC_12716, partial [Pristionchus mayeri]